MAANPLSIPDWSYSEGYYAASLAHWQLEIRTDPLKGKGLFTKRPFREGETVLEEAALGCSQNLDEFVAGIPVCPTCIRSLETPHDIVARLASEKLARCLPAEAKAATTVPVKCRNEGCSTKYCSTACEERGYLGFHSVQCDALSGDSAKAAFKELCAESWVQDGIDLTDTVFLALRFVAQTLVRHRRGAALEDAFAPVAQLIRASIDKFTFTYLLVDEFESATNSDLEGEGEEQRRMRRWEHFCKFKSNPSGDPIVAYAHSQDSGGSTARSKQMMTEHLSSLLALIFAMSPVEHTFFSPTRVSEMLGAVLLNGQERSPNSPYVDMVAELRSVRKGALIGFVREARLAGIDPHIFESSAHGQGVYAVGACFNHSCEPNIQVSYVDRNDETLFVTALRDIAADEELCISYIDEDDHVVVRQQQLFEHYLFPCGCPKCHRELKELDAAKTAPDASSSA